LPRFPATLARRRSACSTRARSATTSSGLEPAVQSGVRTAAFNITILSHLIGTPFLPNLAGHVVMLEEVAEAMYRIDRAMLHITSNPDMRRVAGIMLGRCSAIPENDPAFEQSEEDVVKHWCHVSHIPYLGRADIGHDSHNKIVPFGRPLFF
jgi:muramoyltetrapeptide carboxypeptidase